MFYESMPSTIHKCPNSHYMKWINVNPYHIQQKHVKCDICLEHLEWKKGFVHCFECMIDYCKTCRPKEFRLSRKRAALVNVHNETSNSSTQALETTNCTSVGPLSTEPAVAEGSGHRSSLSALLLNNQSTTTEQLSSHNIIHSPSTGDSIFI